MTTNSTGTPLRHRMIDDMVARKLGRHTQRSHIESCKRFAAFLKRSPDTATADDLRRFQLHLAEIGISICNRNRIMTGVKFLFRVTLRRHDLAAAIYHLQEPQKLPLIISPAEAKRLLAMAGTLQAHVMLALGYGCGLRAGAIVRLKAGDIDSAQMIIRVVQSKGRKDRHESRSPPPPFRKSPRSLPGRRLATAACVRLQPSTLQAPALSSLFHLLPAAQHTIPSLPLPSSSVCFSLPRHPSPPALA